MKTKLSLLGRLTLLAVLSMMPLLSQGDRGQITGTVSSPRGEQQISEGKIDGDAISFTVVVEFNGNQMKFLYKGKVAGDEIKFTREREGGQEGAREFTAKRSS